jgi:hypothetical protein
MHCQFYKRECTSCMYVLQSCTMKLEINTSFIIAFMSFEQSRCRTFILNRRIFVGINDRPNSRCRLPKLPNKYLSTLKTKNFYLFDLPKYRTSNFRPNTPQFVTHFRLCWVISIICRIGKFGLLAVYFLYIQS